MGAKPNIAVLILAAGESRRMGEKIKQLLPWKNSTLLGNALTQSKKSKANDLYLVLGANSQTIKEIINTEDVVVLDNKNWQSGMGSSIKTGLEYIAALEKEYDAVLIMLADQPLMDHTYLNQLIISWQASEKTIVATKYRSRAGVPAIFDKMHFLDLQKLNKDYGAKHLLDKNDILVVDPKGKEIDIDTWETYQELMKN